MLTKRQRLAAWIKLDSERRHREEAVAQVTARLDGRTRQPSLDSAIDTWATTLYAAAMRPSSFIVAP